MATVTVDGVPMHPERHETGKVWKREEGLGSELDAHPPAAEASVALASASQTRQECQATRMPP